MIGNVKHEITNGTDAMSAMRTAYELAFAQLEPVKDDVYAVGRFVRTYRLPRESYSQVLELLADELVWKDAEKRRPLAEIQGMAKRVYGVDLPENLEELVGAAQAKGRCNNALLDARDDVSEAMLSILHRIYFSENCEFS